MAVRGLMGTMANPSANDAPLSAWADRSMAAHRNAVENLVVFAPLALAVHIMNMGSALTGWACAVFFFARLVHYLVYAAGIPVLRTLAFAVGWVVQVILALRLLGVL
jgi:uncharacterized MAPEG superfamily protein